MLRRLGSGLWVGLEWEQKLDWASAPNAWLDFRGISQGLLSFWFLNRRIQLHLHPRMTRLTCIFSDGRRMATLFSELLQKHSEKTSTLLFLCDISWFTYNEVPVTFQVFAVWNDSEWFTRDMSSHPSFPVMKIEVHRCSVGSFPTWLAGTWNNLIEQLSLYFRSEWQSTSGVIPLAAFHSS